MFERFTERARQVVVLAQDEARGLGHNYIGTEHLLLGLLRAEEGAGARALQALGITLEETRAHVVRVVGRGDDLTVGQIPFTPHAKRALELSLREALSLGHESIDTEHVLLGLLREGEGVGAQVLGELGVDADTVREAIVRMVFGRAAAAEVLLTDTWDPGWTGYGRLRPDATSATATPVSAPEQNTPEPAPPADSMLLRGLLLGWALGAGTLGAGLLVGWLIWG